MGRPRNTPNSTDAKTKLIDAFWDLLQDNNINEISVGMIVVKASVNRGTFYYHFEDKESFIAQSVEGELHSAAHLILSLITGVGFNEPVILGTNPHINKMALLMNRGGSTIVGQEMKRYISFVWNTLLYPNGGTLNSKTRMILEYLVSGALGLLAFIGNTEEVESSSFPYEFLIKHSQLAISYICNIENISPKELIMRFKMFNQISNSSTTRNRISSQSA